MNDEEKTKYIRVYNPEHSEFVQEQLFNLGYEWSPGHTKVIMTGEECLCLTDKRITHSDEKWAKGERYERIYIDDLLAEHAIKKFPLNEYYDAHYRVGGKTIEVGCQTIEVSEIRELLNLIDDE